MTGGVEDAVIFSGKHVCKPESPQGGGIGMAGGWTKTNKCPQSRRSNVTLNAGTGYAGPFLAGRIALKRGD